MTCKTAFHSVLSAAAFVLASCNTHDAPRDEMLAISAQTSQSASPPAMIAVGPLPAIEEPAPTVRTCVH